MPKPNTMDDLVKLIADKSIEFMATQGVNVVTPSTDKNVVEWANYIAQAITAKLQEVDRAAYERGYAEGKRMEKMSNDINNASVY